jgi:hypothetical protein
MIGLGIADPNKIITILFAWLVLAGTIGIFLPDILGRRKSQSPAVIVPASRFNQLTYD